MKTKRAGDLGGEELGEGAPNKTTLSHTHTHTHTHTHKHTHRDTHTHTHAHAQQETLSPLRMLEGGVLLPLIWEVLDGSNLT